jgi:membrane protease YdiL (CAAX protease family)
LLLQFSGDLFSFAPENYRSTISRIILASTFGLAMWRYLPSARKRIVAVPSKNRILIAGLIIVPILIQVYSRNPLSLSPLSEFLLIISATLCIGIAEEFLSRGIVFSLFEKSGIWKAVAISSISFGVMHYMSLEGSSDFERVKWHVVSSTSIAFLFAGLMVFTKSIWVPITFHSLYNLPILQSGVGGQSIQQSVSSHFISQVIITSFLQIGIAFLLIQYSLNGLKRFEMLLFKFKLIEKPVGD